MHFLISEEDGILIMHHLFKVVLLYVLTKHLELIKKM